MQRHWEFDALRGLMLVLMTITHLPTRLSGPMGQPFGFVSAAEGFVLLSGFMAGMVYTARAQRHGTDQMRLALWQRALKVYACQAALLVFLLTIIALLGSLGGQAAVINLLGFYAEQPLVAWLAGLSLVYAPPLLDILPMYVVFLLLSPLVLLQGMRGGWGLVLGLSVALWLGAQFGMTEQVYAAVVAVTGLPVPYSQTGAFDGLAWQFLWVLGLWLGWTQAERVRQASGAPDPGSHVDPAALAPLHFPRWMLHLAVAVAATGLLWRHGVGQVPFPGVDTLNQLFSKWHLGPLRIINLFALMVLVIHFSNALTRRLPRWRVLEQLGAASLPVFCAHLVVVLLALALVGEVRPERPLWIDAGLLVLCFGSLWLVARLDSGISRQRASGRAAVPRAALPVAASAGR